MKYFAFMLALPALSLPNFAAPAPRTDLVVHGPRAGLHSVNGTSTDNKTVSKELDWEQSSIKQLWDIEAKVDQILASHTGTQTEKEVKKLWEKVFSQLSDAVDCLGGSQPGFSWFIDGSGGLDGPKNWLLETVANATVEAVGSIMEKAVRLVSVEENVDDMIVCLVGALVDHLQPITSVVDGLEEDLLEILQSHLPTVLGVWDTGRKENLYRRTAETEKHDGLELLSERLRTFTVDMNKTVTDLGHELNGSSRSLGAPAVICYVSMIRHVIEDLAMLLRSSTIELSTVARDFVEARQGNASNLDKLHLHLRTEVVEVVRDVGIVLEMATVILNVELIHEPLKALLYALWPILQSFETSEMKYDVVQASQAAMETHWKDVHPMVVDILSKLERDDPYPITLPEIDTSIMCCGPS